MKALIFVFLLAFISCSKKPKHTIVDAIPGEEVKSTKTSKPLVLDRHVKTKNKTKEKQ